MKSLNQLNSSSIKPRANAATCVLYLIFALLASAYSISRPPIVYPDSIGYQETAEESFGAVNMLTSIRTPVYPLVLRLSKITTGGFAATLAFQTAIFILAVNYFTYQLIRVGYKTWVAILSTTPLLFSPLLLKFGHTYLTETLGTAFSIFAFASLIPFLKRRQSRNDFIILSVTTFLAVLTRPAFIFIPPFVFLASATLGQRSSGEKKTLTSLAKLPLTLLAVTTFPLLTYALIRLLVVGQFGLVSFGGTNLAGLALNPAILTTDVVKSFKDAETKEAAQAILRRRQELLIKGIPNLPNAPKYLLDENEFPKQPILETWSAAYNISCWEIGVPAIATHLGVTEKRGTPTWPLINQTLAKVSKEAIIANPMPYARWVITAMSETARRFFRVEPLQCKFISFFMIAIAFLALWRLLPTIKFSRTKLFISITLLLSLLLSFLVLGPNYFQVLSTLVFLVNGTISPVLIPGFFLAFAICNLLVVIIQKLTGTSILNPVYSTILSASGLYLLSGLLLVVLVEEPLDRYIMAILPPFSVGVFLGLSQASEYLVSKRHSTAAMPPHNQ